MKSKGKTLAVILSLFAQLSFIASVWPAPAQISDNASEQEIVRSATAPEANRLTLVSFLPVIVEGKIVGRLAVYDNAASKRPADYLELYNSTGDLLAVSWFDRFGIQRMAVDRGLVEQGDELEGVFVLIAVEDPI